MEVVAGVHHQRHHDRRQARDPKEADQGLQLPRASLVALAEDLQGFIFKILSYNFV